MTKVFLAILLPFLVLSCSQATDDLKQKTTEKNEYSDSLIKTTNNTEEAILDEVKLAIAFLKDYDCNYTSKDAILEAGTDFEKYRALLKNVQMNNKFEQKTVEELKRNLITAQKKCYPILRKNYTDIVNKTFWVENVDTKLKGRIIEFTGTPLANRRNIQDINTGLSSSLKTLRFEQARYFWSKYDEEYQYFEFNSPKDIDVEN